MADATQLHQVGMNLITNAYHAVEDFDGTIIVQLKAVDLDGNEASGMSLKQGKYALLSVSDNGVGIAKDNLNKIFDSYFTTKSKGKGNGLGLFVVYKIVKEHKGAIEVVSELGKGATFNVYLPLINKSTQTESVDETANIQTGNERILLVDDDIFIVQLGKQMLETVRI